MYSCEKNSYGNYFLGRQIEHKEYEYVAICTSVYCCRYGGKLENGYTKGVRKNNVNRQETYCPDCGYALYWDRREIKK